MFAQFFLPLSTLPVPCFFYECSQDFFVSLARFGTFYEKIGSLSLVSLFRRRVMFLTKKVLANQVCIQYYNTTHCSLVEFRRLFWNKILKYYLKVILLLKATDAIQKTYFRKKTILSNQETWDLSLFLGRFKLPLFYTRSLLNIRYHAFDKVEERFSNSSFFLKKFFFRENEEVSAFLANSIPVIRTNECQRTVGESPRIVCNTIHVFDNTNTGLGYACKCEKIFNANER